jgi:uncharacterized protein
MPYHVRRSDRAIADQEQMVAIIENCRYATIALSKGNEPYLVTLSYGYDKTENALYFHCGKEGQKIDFLKSNPKV